MSFDAEALGPGVDIDTIDTSTMDRGDSLEKLEDALSETDNEEVKQVAEDLTKQKEVVEGKAEEKADEEKAEEESHPKDPKTGRFEAKIPKSRFDEQVGKERAAREAAEQRVALLERQIAENQQRGAQAADIEAMEAKVSELEKQYGQLLIDGEAEKASEVMSQIRKAERKIATIEAETKAMAKTTQVLESERLDLAIAQLEAEHPVLNPDSEQFDEALVSFVLSEQRRLMEKEGLSPSKAMSKAATTIVEKYGPKPEAEPEPEQKGLTKAAEDRKSEQVKRNIQAAQRQPASMKDVGLDSDKLGQTSLPDVTKMSQEEFDALPESTKSKLRGDYL